MHLMQILLPLSDNEGAPFPPELYRRLSAELTERFGGLTAFTRAPAEGRWKEGGGDGDVATDEIVILEVMTDTLERAWWAGFRARLEREFRQERILIRAQAVELI